MFVWAETSAGPPTQTRSAQKSNPSPFHSLRIMMIWRTSYGKSSPGINANSANMPSLSGCRPTNLALRPHRTCCTIGNETTRRQNCTRGGCKESGWSTGDAFRFLVALNDVDLTGTTIGGRRPLLPARHQLRPRNPGPAKTTPHPGRNPEDQSCTTKPAGSPSSIANTTPAA